VVISQNYSAFHTASAHFRRRLHELGHQLGKQILLIQRNLENPVKFAHMTTLDEAKTKAATTYNAWDRISEPDDLRALFNAAGLTESEIVAETGSQPVNSPEDWWAMILGSGYRGTVEQLTTDHREGVRLANNEYITRAAVRSVESNVVYAVAVKR
jgi:hypothetical protein